MTNFRKQFEKETGLEAVISSWYPTVELARPEYTEHLETKLQVAVEALGNIAETNRDAFSIASEALKEIRGEK